MRQPAAFFDQDRLWRETGRFQPHFFIVERPVTMILRRNFLAAVAGVAAVAGLDDPPPVELYPQPGPACGAPS